MKKNIIAIKGNRFCVAEIEVKNGRCSICGTAGRIVSRRQALREARQYWRSFFKEQPEEIADMRKRFPEFRAWSPQAAARFVLDTDGELHGLDVHKEDNSKVYLTESCGQITEELAEFHPWLVPFLKYHLNDLHAGCEHQDARGETYDKNPGAVCPDCGWKLGHGWHKRELPADLEAQIEKAQATA